MMFTGNSHWIIWDGFHLTATNKFRTWDESHETVNVVYRMAVVQTLCEVVLICIEWFSQDSNEMTLREVVIEHRNINNIRSLIKIGTLNWCISIGYWNGITFSYWKIAVNYHWIDLECFKCSFGKFFQFHFSNVLRFITLFKKIIILHHRNQLRVEILMAIKSP